MAVYRLKIFFLKKNCGVRVLSVLTAIKDFDVPNMHLSIFLTLFPTNIFRAIFLLEAVARTCSVKKVLLEISQNPQENTFARVDFLTKLQAEAFTFVNPNLGGLFRISL